MALLSGTAAQLALDFLRSGRILKEGGLETLQKAYKATNRGEAMPEEAVSEFRKILNALKAADAADRIRITRLYRQLPDEFRMKPEKADIFQYTGTGSRKELEDVAADLQFDLGQEELNPNYARDEMITQWGQLAMNNPRKRPRYASSAKRGIESNRAQSMQGMRWRNAKTKADLERITALLNLFGSLS